MVRLSAPTVRLCFERRFGLSAMRPMRRKLCRRRFCAGISDWRAFEQRSAFGTWIYRIAVNCALNRVGKPEIEAEYRHGEESDPEEKTVQVAAQDAGPERVLLSREIKRGAGDGDAAADAGGEDSVCAAAPGGSLDERDRRGAGDRAERGETGGVSRGAEIAAGTGAAAGDRMKHLSEEELVELYYGEGGAPASRASGGVPGVLGAVCGVEAEILRER